MKVKISIVLSELSRTFGTSSLIAKQFADIGSAACPRTWLHSHLHALQSILQSMTLQIRFGISRSSEHWLLVPRVL